MFPLFSMRMPYGVSLLFLFLLALLLAVGCGGPSEPPPTGTSSAWPEADALFKSDPRWLGGDIAYAVPLGDERTLWLFGTSYVDLGLTGDRALATSVRNTVAVQTGLDPSLATIQFHWGDAGGAPEAFFARDDGDWLWPNDGMRIGDTLILFYSRMRATVTPGPFQFTRVGCVALRVMNPDDDPSSWLVVEVDLPAIGVDAAIGVSTYRRDGFVYAYEVPDAPNGAYLLRWTDAQFESADLTAPEWWSGDQAGWISGTAGVVAPVFHKTPPSFSVSYDATRSRIVLTESLGHNGGFLANHLGVRFASRIEGPFGISYSIFRPAEVQNDVDAFVNGGHAHPHLLGAELVSTYVPNHLDQNEVIANPDFLYPRFVRTSLSAVPLP